MKTYLDHIRQTLIEEIQQDPRVFLLGEDIGQYGGAFKLTSGLLQRFGQCKVIDSPITETGIIGTAAGAAIMGFRPVVEMQFIDFMSCAFNQLTNLVAKFCYRTSIHLPIVVRGPSGGGGGAGPFHSQSPEAYYLHTPGLKIVYPATPEDASALLRASIRDDDPVIFLEHKYLYRKLKQKQELQECIPQLGKASIRRHGSDLTIITYGAAVHLSLDTAKQLHDSESIEVEVIDLRTLLPLDIVTIASSVQKTNKAIIVHEATRIGGPACEIITQINETVFDFLDAPLLRVTAADAPVPYNLQLEAEFHPSIADIADACRWLLNY